MSTYSKHKTTVSRVVKARTWNSPVLGVVAAISYSGPAQGYCWKVRRVSFTYDSGNDQPLGFGYFLNMMNEPLMLDGNAVANSAFTDTSHAIVSDLIPDPGNWATRDFAPRLYVPQRYFLAAGVYGSPYVPNFSSRIEYDEYRLP